MKKIMFDSRHFGLTQSVLSGYKTMTRRIIPQMAGCNPTECEWGIDDKGKTYYSVFENDKFVKDVYPKYQYGEIVAVAQSYKSIHDEMMNGDYGNSIYDAFRDLCIANHKGWNNKMFVRADLMPHQIQITNLDVQRLQDISDEDCLKEGVVRRKEKHPRQEWEPEYTFGDGKFHAQNPRAAFVALIDKLSGKGTWDKNPYVFVYSFKLVR